MHCILAGVWTGGCVQADFLVFRYCKTWHWIFRLFRTSDRSVGCSIQGPCLKGTPLLLLLVLPWCAQGTLSSKRDGRGLVTAWAKFRSLFFIWIIPVLSNKMPSWWVAFALGVIPVTTLWPVTAIAKVIISFFQGVIPATSCNRMPWCFLGVISVAFNKMSSFFVGVIFAINSLSSLFKTPSCVQGLPLAFVWGVIVVTNSSWYSYLQGVNVVMDYLLPSLNGTLCSNRTPPSYTSLLGEILWRIVLFV